MKFYCLQFLLCCIVAFASLSVFGCKSNTDFEQSESHSDVVASNNENQNESSVQVEPYRLTYCLVDGSFA